MTRQANSTEADRRFLSRWTAAVQRFAGLLVALLAAITGLAAAYTATNLAINTSTTDMISPETPFRRNAIAFNEAFPQFRNRIVIVVDAKTAEDAQAAARALTDGLRARPGLFESVEWPAGDAFFAKNGLLYKSEDALSTLVDRLAEAEPLLATLAQQPNLVGLFDVLTLALRDGNNDEAIGRLLQQIEMQIAGADHAMSWRSLLGLGAQTRHILLAKPAAAAGSLSPGSRAIAEIRSLTDNLIGADARQAGGPTVSVRLTGSVALDHEELKSAAVGGRTAGLISLALVSLLLLIGLRSASLIIPALLTLIVGLVWTAAFAALAIGHLNLISVAFAVLFVGLGIDFSIHLCLRYQEAANDPALADRALATAAADVGPSLAIGALCAALGFLAFLPTDYRGLAELGIISAGGMAIALVLNLTLLLALLKLFPTPKARPAVRDAAYRLGRHRLIVLSAAALGLFGVGFSTQAGFDFNPMNLKDPKSESVRTYYDLAAESSLGIYAINLLAADRQSARESTRRLGDLPGVGSTVTIDDLIPGKQPEKLSIIEDAAFFLAAAIELPEQAGRGLDPAERRGALDAFRGFAARYAKDANAPFAAEAGRIAEALQRLTGAAEIAKLETRLVGHLPGMLSDLRLALSAGRITLDTLPQTLRASWLTSDGRARIQLLPAKPIAGNAELRQFATEVLEAAPTAVGTPVTITEAGREVVTAFQQATLYAFGAVCIVLLLVLRSVRDTVLVIVPLILAALYTGATSYLLGLQFNFANIIVLPLLFGLGVASGIHLVIRSRRAADTESLMRTSTPRAVLFSALTTIASFGSLALSGHRGMTSMGQLLTIAIAYALICALVVLPALLVWLQRRADR